MSIHFHMLFVDGVYSDSENESNTQFRWVKAPTRAELTQLTHTIAHRVGRFLECQGLLERDAENSYLTGMLWKAARRINFWGTPFELRWGPTGRPAALRRMHDDEGFENSRLASSISQGETHAGTDLTAGVG